MVQIFLHAVYHISQTTAPILTAIVRCDERGLRKREHIDEFERACGDVVLEVYVLRRRVNSQSRAFSKARETHILGCERCPPRNALRDGQDERSWIFVLLQVRRECAMQNEVARGGKSVGY